MRRKILIRPLHPDSYPGTPSRRLAHEAVPHEIYVPLTHNTDQFQVESPEKCSDCNVKLRVGKAVTLRIQSSRLNIVCSKIGRYSLHAETHAMAASKRYIAMVQALNIVFRAKPALRLKAERIFESVGVCQSFVRSHPDRYLRTLGQMKR